VLLCEAAANADMEGPVPSAVLVETLEGPEVPALATPAMLEVDGDELLDSTWTAVLVGTGADVAMIPVMIDHVDACRWVATTVADANDGGPLLKTFADGVRETVPVIPKVLDHVDTPVAAARVVVNDVLLLEAAADENMEVLVPSAVLVDAVSAAVEGSGVLQFATPAAPGELKVEEDEWLDSDKAEVRAGTEGAVPRIPEMTIDVNASVVASRAAENEVPEAVANADAEGPVPPAVLVKAVSATIEGLQVPAFATPAVPEGDGDKLRDSTRAAVLVGTGSDAATSPVVISRADTCRRVPTTDANADDFVPLLKTFADGVRETVSGILTVVDHANTLVAAAHVTENDVPLLEAPANANVDARASRSTG